MKLLSFRIKNYKSINDTGEIRISDRIIILVGKNESGKTNIIEAFEIFTCSQIDFNEPLDSLMIKDIESKLNISIKQEDKNSIDHFEFIFNTELEHNETKKFSDSLRRKRNITFVLTIKNDKFKRIIRSKKRSAQSKEKIILSIEENTKRWASFYKEKDFSFSKTFIKIYGTMKQQIKIPIKIPSLGKPIQNIQFQKLPSWWIMALNSICKNKFFSLNDLNSKKNKFKEQKNLIEEQKIFKKMKLLLKKINSLLKKFFFEDTGLRDFPLALEFHSDGPSWVNIGFIEKTKSSDAFFSIDKRSTGMQSFLIRWVIIRFILSTDFAHESIVLLDEPDTHLHESLQIKFLKLLEKLAKKNCIVIFSTHSTVLPSYENLDRICVVRRGKKNGTKVKNWHSLKKELNFKPHTINEVIGGAMAYSIHSWTTKNNLIVEGVTDEFFLKGIKNVVIDLFDGVEKKILQQLNIIKAHGSHRAEPYVKILSSWGCKWIVLFDYDQGGFQGTERLLKSFALKDIKEKLIYTKAREPNQDFDDFLFKMEKEKLSIENLFSDSDKKKYKIFANLKDEKKYETARNFSNKKLEPTEETKNNFKDLFQRILECFKANK